jgi:hypothetical protein
MLRLVATVDMLLEAGLLTWDDFRAMRFDGDSFQSLRDWFRYFLKQAAGDMVQHSDAGYRVVLTVCHWAVSLFPYTSRCSKDAAAAAAGVTEADDGEMSSNLDLILRWLDVNTERANTEPYWIDLWRVLRTDQHPTISWLDAGSLWNWENTRLRPEAIIPQRPEPIDLRRPIVAKQFALVIREDHYVQDGITMNHYQDRAYWVQLLQHFRDTVLKPAAAAAAAVFVPKKSE